jgi:hypothetical protein
MFDNTLSYVTPTTMSHSDLVLLAEGLEKRKKQYTERISELQNREKELTSLKNMCVYSQEILKSQLCETNYNLSKLSTIIPEIQQLDQTKMYEGQKIPESYSFKVKVAENPKFVQYLETNLGKSKVSITNVEIFTCGCFIIRCNLPIAACFASHKNEPSHITWISNNPRLTHLVGDVPVIPNRASESYKICAKYFEELKRNMSKLTTLKEPTTTKENILQIPQSSKLIMGTPPIVGENVVQSIASSSSSAAIHQDKKRKTPMDDED